MAKTTELEKRFLKKVLTKIENRKQKLEAERQAWIKNKEELENIVINPKLNNAHKLGNVICELGLLQNELLALIS